MKKKTKALVLGKTFKISYDNLDNHKAYGLCSPSDSLIIIHNNLSPEDEIHTILHEEMHALFHRSGVEQAISQELQEVLCENVATFITENYHLKPKSIK